MVASVPCWLDAAVSSAATTPSMATVVSSASIVEVVDACRVRDHWDGAVPLDFSDGQPNQ
eukprot:scaffold13321_cov193-Alexandrium_tamarense.AAC.1